MAEVLPFDRKSFYSQVQSTRVYLESDKVQTGIPKRSQQGQQFCSKSVSLFDLALKHVTRPCQTQLKFIPQAA